MFIAYKMKKFKIIRNKLKLIEIYRNLFFVTLLTMGLFALSIQAYTQPDLDTLRIDIIKEYQPSLSGAMKITDNPRITDTLTLKPVLKYSLLPVYVKTDFKVESVQPVKIKGEPLNRLYRANIKAGLGNYTTAFAEGSLSTLRSRDYSTGINMKHLSSSGQINERGFSGYSDQAVRTFGKRFFRFHTLSGDAAWTRNVVHYYGYDPLDYDNYNDSLIEDNIRQRLSLFEGRIGFGTTQADSSHIRWMGGVDFNTLNDLFNVAETNIKFSGNGSRYVGNEMMTVNLLIDRYYTAYDTLPSSTNTLINLNPVVTSQGKKYRFDIGLNAFAEHRKGTSGLGYYFYPHVFASYRVFEQYFIPYASLGGNLEKNHLAGLTRVNPWLNTNSNLKNSYSGLILRGGIKGQVSKFTTYDIELSGGKTDTMYFFVNDFSDSLGNKFTLEYDNVEHISAAVNVLHEPSSKLKILYRAVYHQYSMDSLDKPWHRPSFETTLSVFYNLRDKIRTRCDLYGAGSSYARVLNGAGGYKAEKISGYADVNLSVEYIYNKSLSVFVTFNNITAARYRHFYNYPVQRFQFLFGMSVSF